MPAGCGGSWARSSSVRLRRYSSSFQARTISTLAIAVLQKRRIDSSETDPLPDLLHQQPQDRLPAGNYLHLADHAELHAAAQLPAPNLLAHHLDAHRVAQRVVRLAGRRTGSDAADR